MKSLLLHKLKNILSKRMPPKWLRVLTLATLFMAGGGLDIKSLFNLSIPMSIFYLVLLIALVIKYVNVEIEEMLIALGVFMTMFIVYVFKGSMLDWWILPVILQGFVVLCFYKEIPNKFLGDLRCLCEIYMYYTIVGIALLFLLGGGISSTGFFRYRHLFYLFFYTSGMGVGTFRFTGLGGEPGIWQMFLSFNLLFALYEKRSLWKILLALLAIIGIISTTGYFILIFVVLYYYGIIERKIKFSYFIIILFVISAFYGILYDDINEKLKNSSGLVRISDLFIGMMYLGRNPLFGINPGIVDSSRDSGVQTIRYLIAKDSDKALGDQGYFDSGLCSGLIIFLLDYGLLFASYFLYKFFQFPLIKDKYLKFGVLSIILLTLMTEPYSRSGWFYLFVLASFVKFRWPLSGRVHLIKVRGKPK